MMAEKLKLHVVGYTAEQETFSKGLQLKVNILVGGVKPTEQVKYIDDVINAIQGLEIDISNE